MQFIDTHTHLQDDKLNNTTEIIARAQDAGCKKIICVSAQEEEWERVASLAREHPSVIIPAFGIHPWYVNSQREGWQSRLEKRLSEFPRAMVGECGLDGLKPNLEKQKLFFAEQIKLAKQLKRPLIIHAVKAVPLMEVFWKELPNRFVFHGFNDKAEFLQKILKNGGYVGIGSGLLKTPKAKEILKKISANKLLFETDAPFQAEGSWKIRDQAEKIAELRDDFLEDLSAQVYKNSEEFIKF